MAFKDEISETSRGVTASKSYLLRVKFHDRTNAVDRYNCDAVERESHGSGAAVENRSRVAIASQL